MNKILLLLLTVPFIAFTQSSMNMNLLGTYEYPTTNGNDIWGWVDASENEFAIVGLRDGVSCVNVTNPTGREVTTKFAKKVQFFPFYFLIIIITSLIN